MATGATYLNSNVSLISNASIRYEGTLYSINPQEATITLSNVRSYGTEDRKVDKFLAPKDTLFEYIIFKANDIKELIVDEPFNDPAIVTATAQQRPNSTNNSNNYGSVFNDNSSLQANGQSSSDQQNVSINQASAPSVSSAGQNDRQRSENSTPEHTSTSELSTSKQQKHDSNKSIRQQNSHHQNSRQQHQNNTNNSQRRGGWDNRGRNNVNYHQQNYQRYDRNRNNNNYYHNNNNNQVRRGQYQNHQNYQNHQIQRGQYYRGGNGNNYRQDTNRGGYRSNQSYQNNQRFKGYRKFNQTEGEKLKGFDDYDFETANNKFIEDMTNGLNNLQISNGERSGTDDNDTTTNNSTLDKELDDANFYNKEKSFFDNISCEAIERSKGSQQKFDWKKEKSLNAETFGFKITVRTGPEGKIVKPIFFGENDGHRFNNRRYNSHQHRPQHQSRINSS